MARIEPLAVEGLNKEIYKAPCYLKIILEYNVWIMFDPAPADELLEDYLVKLLGEAVVSERRAWLRSPTFSGPRALLWKWTIEENNLKDHDVILLQ